VGVVKPAALGSCRYPRVRRIDPDRPQP
jgi:hypothetical protein